MALELQAFFVLPFQQTTDLIEKLRAQKVAFEELIIPDEIHDLLRWSDWIRSSAPVNNRAPPRDVRHAAPKSPKPGGCDDSTSTRA